MSYIGIAPSTAAFPFDQFSGNGTTTAFTMSYAPASTTSMVVCISGVVQNPNTYSIVGLTLTFSAAPPTGTNNIGVLYLGIPATSVVSPGNTAYLTTTSFTATAGQTTFTPSATYQVGYINVIRNGSQLAPADFTATNGTTVVLNNACVAGDVVVTQGYTLSSIANALPSTGGTVTGATTFNSSVTINGGSASGYTGYKNRIINGGMVIDQRNNGSAITVNSNTGNQFGVDRFLVQGTSAEGVFTAQQLSATPPSGFKNYLRIQTTTASASPASGSLYALSQIIEGFNIYDLGFGAAGAATVTFSFWIRCSLTGTFAGSLKNGQSYNRSYPFTYTISVANTWEYKTVTVVGDTSGTWQTGNLGGLVVYWDIGCGSSLVSTANSWQSGNYNGVTGSTRLISTLNATLDVTGVQLERGSNATSFEFRDYGRELQMCQRYYRFANCANRDNGASANTKAYANSVNFQNMRAAPSVTFTAVTSTNVSSRSASNITEYGFTYNTVASASPSMFDESIATCSIEL